MYHTMMTSMPHYVIDFDSTLVSLESLGLLADIALKDDPKKDEKITRIKDITERGMNGEISFTESLGERLALLSLKTRHVEEVKKLVQQYISPSAFRNKAWFTAHAPFIYVISGGFKEIILPVTNLLGLAADHVYANTFVVDQHDVISGCDPQNLLAQEKGKERQARALGIMGEIIIVGDGMTDYEMKGAYPQAKFLYFAEHIQREKVMALADGVLDSFDVLCSSDT